MTSTCETAKNINYNSIKNINYNYEFLCTYKSLDEDYYRNLCYQIQLLQAFNMNKYEDFILSKNIEKLYYCLKDYYEIDIILLSLKENYKNTNMAFFIENNVLALFQLLLSYEYFDIFHKCLINYIKDKKQKTDISIKNINKKYFDELKESIISEQSI